MVSLSKLEIRNRVLSVLKEVQELSGRAWSPMKEDSTPVGILEGFDSLASIEATVLLEAKLGSTLKADTVFLTPDGQRARSLDQVCEAIAEQLRAQEVQ